MTSANARSFLLVVLVAVVCNPLHAADNQVHVVPDSQLGQWWLATPGHENAPPQYPPNPDQEGCVAVAFMIHRDGTVSNERAWHNAWSNTQSGKQYDQLALRAVHQWHFVPAATNATRDPVYTYQIFTYTLTMISSMPGVTPMPNHSDRLRAQQHEDTIKAKCEMTDFPQQVQAMINSAQTGKKP